MSTNKALPFLLKPAFKDYIWGGSKLRDFYGKKTSMNPLAESWECSTHPDGLTIVDSGEYLGQSLASVLEKNPSFMGSRALAVAGGKLPILIKLIDANRDLSVQVHPDDNYALKNEHSMGKTEMWYVLEAEPGAEIVYGVKDVVSFEQFSKALVDGSVMDCLNRVPVKKGDCFFIEAGTVHALGKGIVVCEVQENSNVTYRLYDYNRGRELHVQKGLDVVRFDSSCGCGKSCKYFSMETAAVSGSVEMNVGPESFHALVCTDGNGKIVCGGTSVAFEKGSTVFIPAGCGVLSVVGNCLLLDISC